MTKLPNPISQGLRRVLREPAIWITEIVWRWSFGAIASLLLFFSISTLLHSVNASPLEVAAWRSNNPSVMAQALANMLADSGPKLVQTAAWVLPLITLLWIVFGACGRAFTLSRLSNQDVSFRSIFALQAVRALLIWLAGAALIAAIVLDARISTRGPRPDLFLYYAVAFWSFAFIGGFWATANWYLTLAALCCLQSGAGFMKGTRQAFRLARTQGGDFSGISLVHGILRLVLLAIAFVLCVLPSGLMGTAPQGYFAWVVTVSLAYFAVADYLYISRMAAYLMVETRTAPAGDQKLRALTIDL
jgi:hypothetical protein